MRLARWIFLVAGIYGLAVLAPSFFMPPRGADPHFYLGFLGLALVWQFAFLLIASDPARFRPLMAIAVLEKFSFFSVCVWLVALGQANLSEPPVIGGMIDGVLMALFALAWMATKPKPA